MIAKAQRSCARKSIRYAPTWRAMKLQIFERREAHRTERYLGHCWAVHPDRCE